MLVLQKTACLILAILCVLGLIQPFQAKPKPPPPENVNVGCTPVPKNISATSAAVLEGVSHLFTCMINCFNSNMGLDIQDTASCTRADQIEQLQKMMEEADVTEKQLKNTVKCLAKGCQLLMPTDLCPSPNSASRTVVKRTIVIIPQCVAKSSYDFSNEKTRTKIDKSNFSKKESDYDRHHNADVKKKHDAIYPSETIPETPNEHIITYGAEREEGTATEPYRTGFNEEEIKSNKQAHPMPGLFLPPNFNEEKIQSNRQGPPIVGFTPAPNLHAEGIQSGQREPPNAKLFAELNFNTEKVQNNQRDTLDSGSIPASDFNDEEIQSSQQEPPTARLFTPPNLNVEGIQNNQQNPIVAELSEESNFNAEEIQSSQQRPSTAGFIPAPNLDEENIQNNQEETSTVGFIPASNFKTEEQSDQQKPPSAGLFETPNFNAEEVQNNHQDALDAGLFEAPNFNTEEVQNNQQDILNAGSASTSDFNEEEIQSTQQESPMVNFNTEEIQNSQQVSSITETGKNITPSNVESVDNAENTNQSNNAESESADIINNNGDQNPSGANDFENINMFGPTVNSQEISEVASGIGITGKEDESSFDTNIGVNT